MTINSFLITKKEGKEFSIFSGDSNKIHIDEKTGYNSIYGNIICYGALVFLKFLKKIKFKEEKFFNIKITFNKPFFYKSKIIIKKKFRASKIIEYSLWQANIEKANIIIDFNNINNKKIYNYNKLSNYYLNEKPKKKYYSDIDNNLLAILLNVSRYTGMVYPGKNSILSNININFNSKIKYKNEKIKIESKLLDSRLPLIKNKLTIKNFIVTFDTIKRPIVSSKKIKINQDLIKRIKKIKENILIIGASQGLGKDVFSIMIKNKKIFKIGSYFKNKIIIKAQKTIIKKINIEKDLKLINKIIKKYSPIRVYYFPTPKIFFNRKLEKKIINSYEKFYIKLPLNILKKNKNQDMSFFYPSTKHIEIDKKSVYSKVKLLAEKKVKNFCNKNKIPLYMHRYPGINSKQSISLSNMNLPNLAQYIKENKNFVERIFPKKILKWHT